jgi:N-acetylglucosamine-6-phosphate deacetylase
MVAIASAVREVALSLLDATEAATAIPAQILGVEDRFGRLKPGYVADADAGLFDSDWQVRRLG